MNSNSARPIGSFKRWVWIDLDDTIIDFTRNAAEALVKLYDTFGLNRFFNSPEQWTEIYEHHNTALWVDYSVGRIDSSYLRRQRFERPLAQQGAPARFIEENWQKLDKTYLDFLAEGRHTIPGALELLRYLHNIPGLGVGILSNGFAEVQYRKMDRVGVTPYIDLTVLSDHIGINKPDVRIFTHAMEQTGITDPQLHTMIGDNPATDIQGAINAGWNAFWFDAGRFTDQCPQGATPVKSLLQLLNYPF